MKSPLAIKGWLLAVAAACVVAGCSEKPSETSGAAAPATVQGELIAPVAPVEKPAEPVAVAVAETSPAPASPEVMQPVTTPSAPAVAAAPAPAASVPAPSPVSPAPVEATQVMDGEYLTVGFDKLAGFEYEMPDETSAPTNAVPGEPVAREQIPADIKSLNAKRVALKGFMLPLKVEGGLITELLVMRDQSMCCFGTVPKINEWVSVKMVGKGVKPIMDQAVTIYGALKVGEMYESGYLVGIYALDGERMSGPLDL